MAPAVFEGFLKCMGHSRQKPGSRIGNLRKNYAAWLLCLLEFLGIIAARRLASWIAAFYGIMIRQAKSRNAVSKDETGR